jgi:hypothetical protein
VHEPVVHGVVQTVLAGKLGDEQRVESVREPRRWVKRQPCRLDHLLRVLVDARPVAALEVGARHTLVRVLRVQEERQPVDLRAEPAREPLGPREADVAERSGEIAPNRDGQHVHGAQI